MSAPSAVEYNRLKLNSAIKDMDTKTSEEIRKISGKKDRPNQLFPSVPTSSSVIINSNNCASSPPASPTACPTAYSQFDESLTLINGGQGALGKQYL